MSCCSPLDGVEMERCSQGELHCCIVLVERQPCKSEEEKREVVGGGNKEWGGKREGDARGKKGRGGRRGGGEGNKG